MRNADLINTLTMTDANMAGLLEPGVAKLMGYPNLADYYEIIHRRKPYLGSLQIARLIIIDHELNPNILNNLLSIETLVGC